MPTLTRWFIKAGLLYFVAALGIAVLMYAPGVAGQPWLRAIGPTYVHILVVGWLTQLIFGVAFWLFPRYSADRPRGNELLGRVSFVLLNLGLLLRVLGEPWLALGGNTRSLLLGSAVAQLLGGWLFVANTWPRVKER